MERDLLTTEMANYLLKSQFTTNDDSIILCESELDKQEYCDKHSSFIVDWQEPIPISQVTQKYQ